MINVNKIPIRLYADPKKIITRPSIYPGLERIKRVYERIQNFSDEEVNEILSDVRTEFNHRHKNLEKIFLDNYTFFKNEYALLPELSPNKKLLLGATLTMEYSIQSAALLNPSMVPHPDQSELKKGEQRFIISLRSIGEGHISSIEFREGIVDNSGQFNLKDPSEFSLTGSIIHSESLNTENDYNLSFPDDSELSERVIFPQSRSEIMGMEDLRLVSFTDGNEMRYFGTYTAYDGQTITTQLLETNDFQNFRIRALKGRAATDKGMALFPEKINGNYGMISRQGGECLSIMFSDNLYEWDEYHLLMKPKFPYELSQIGNCGSPVKTPEGWLLLTHGVGPVRQYSISAVLLDLADPRKVIARLNKPLIQPAEDEREGYVPNVVYTCGGMQYKDIFYIPYAMSDTMTGFAYINMSELLSELLK
ncbi:MAG: glycoside hydrolase family 130 protein [Bacteroidales bacterium]|nr:glycoside hydrolase family 130 protein [Bacteroidales bacterium]